MSDQQARCRSCQQRIVWGETKNGKRAPFNASDGANHFSTCPQRREWRKAETPEQASFLDADEAPPTEPTHRRHYE